jgi:hypothetical protein
LSYLRLAPPEYAAIRRVCLRLRLARGPRSAFRRSLLAGLAERTPAVAERVARLRRSEIRLLFEHFSALGEKTDRDALSGLTPDEWATFAEACVSYPLPVRFVRPFRHMLVELFRDVSPDLARKLERLSARQFERLYGRATARKEGSA